MNSTQMTIISVLADPIAPTNPAGTGVQSGRQSPRSTSRTSNRTISRSTVSRAKSGATVTPTRSTVSRASVSRAATSRAITPTRPNATVVSRGVSSRSQSSRGQSTRGTTNNRAVRARSGANVARVSATGNVMSGNTRASVGANQSYLNSRLYTGNYSNIIDSTTGLISAEAYSNCMDAYYTCMDEICTARNAAKGRCSCAGRAEKFLSSEEALQRANEELITLSGQLSLLISTKGKGEDLIAAFSLTDAEKVMNCVSWKDAVATAGSTTAVSTSDGTTKNISHDDYLKQWCKDHLLFDYQNNECLDGIKTTAGSEHGPSYCYETGNDFGFNLADLGSETSSTSDILAQLKSWADAKDLAKQYVNDDGTLLTQYTRLDNSVNALIYNSETTNTSSLDNLANKLGYKLFEYAHNNVCGRVLDSCFNGIYEACGTPITVIDSDEVTHSKCQNGATTSCPFNFNSYSQWM